jgi:predicted Zn-dependent peptidase
VTDRILSHRFDNGLVLVGERMDWLQSAAFSICVPGGCIYDPVDRAGLGNFVCEMVQRGCGDRDSRQFVTDLENLGVDRSSNISTAHASYGGAMLAAKLPEALQIYADLLRRPMLPAELMDEGRAVCFQELRAIEDDLAHKTLSALKQQANPDPWGRIPQGNEEALLATTIDDIRQHFEATYVPANTIVAVAGNFEWEQLRDQVGKLFGDWTSAPLPKPGETPAKRGNAHIEHDSSQTHIGVAYPSTPYSHDDYFQARGAVGILSDGMSSRLFTEVREKRGLCYTVFATLHSLVNSANVLCYSSTSTDRAQETLDVMVQELIRLSDGVEQSELDRLKARIKSGLIMQQESSASRSSSIAADWFHLGRVRTLDEVGSKIDALSCDSINAYLKKNPAGDFAVVSLGQKKLEIPCGISTSDAS